MLWAEERNERSNKKYHVEVLCISDMAELCHWVCVFMKEARHDTATYTTSLTQLLSGIQRFINKREPTELLVKLQETSNAAFWELQNIFEHWFRELHDGVGTERKKAEVISQSEEEVLWEKGVHVLIQKTPLGLLSAEFTITLSTCGRTLSCPTAQELPVKAS